MFQLKDLVYVDQRVRQLLAQVDGGVLERTIERSSDTSTRRQAAHLLRVVDIERALASGSEFEHTLSFEDALLDLLESSLDELGWVQKVERLDDPRAWADGDVHDQLSPGAIIRLKGQTQLLDPDYIKTSVDRSMAALEQMAVFVDGGLEAAARSKNERNKIGRKVARQLMGGLPPDAARQMADVFVAFFGEGLTVRHLPCGPRNRGYAFTGTLSSGAEYMADTRQVLFAKYGSAPSDWTLVAQVAAVPEPVTEEEDDDDETGSESSRAQLEGVAAEILRSLEETGLTGAPAWPTISVTPIAMYRGGRSE